MSAMNLKAISQAYQQSVPNRTRRTIRKTLVASVFVLPGMVVFFVFLLLPMIESAQFGFYKWDGLGPLEDYRGLDNYKKAFDHDVFQTAIINSFRIMGLSLIIQLPVAMLLALMVGRGNLPGRRVFRLLLFLPYVFSEVITALIWRYVMHPTDGLLNWFLGHSVPGYDNVGWLAEKDVVIYSVFIVLTWKYFGFYMILYMAGLQGVPKDLEDAARVDGANIVQVLSRITLPMMGSTVRLTVFLSVLGAFQQFVLVWVLTGGGPVNASQIMGTYIYKFGIKSFNLGYGAAVALILFSITLVFSIGYQRMILHQDFASDVSL
ncbi:MAG: sugar ABC transporter permease [Anaerolineae bacterium]|nr:sugar ABC transporter permease [Anaerolineae bacterium]